MATEQNEFHATLAAARAFRDRYLDLRRLLAERAPGELIDSAWKMAIATFERLLSELDAICPLPTQIDGAVRLVRRLVIKQVGIIFAPPGDPGGRSTLKQRPAGGGGPHELADRQDRQIDMALDTIERELEKLVDEAGHETAVVPVLDDAPVATKKQPRKPSKKAFIAWRLQCFMGISTQTEIAKIMTEQGEPASQGDVSRWLRQVEDYQRAGGKIPPPEMDRAVAVDPKVIVMGQREDGLTQHQRKSWDDDSDQ